MKKHKRFWGFALALAIACQFVNPPSYADSTPLSSITNESIRQKQEQIKASESLSEELKKNMKDAQAIKKELEGLKSDLKAYIESVDAELTDVLANIDELINLIANKEYEIEVITGELEEAERIEAEQYAAMKKRIKFMYEKGDSFYLEMIFSATSYVDLLTKANYIEELSAYDRKMLDEYTQIREWTELCKETLEAEKVSLDDAKAAEESERETLEILLDEKNTQMAEYEKKIKAEGKYIEDLEAELAAQTAAIEALEAAVLEEQKAIAAAQKKRIIYDGGYFAWPCPDYIRVTDEFGWRTDPFTGQSSYHSGIDLGCAYGKDILSAYDGEVVAAVYGDWSMGNYVMINHGDGLFTIYMHASKLCVNKGDIVARGEKIAEVGSTGRSSGNHLHFGVRLNGTYVSPWSYFQN